MHMADALLTPAVAGVMYAASAVVAGASIVELHKEEKQDLTSADCCSRRCLGRGRDSCP